MLTLLSVRVLACGILAVTFLMVFAPWVLDLLALESCLG